MTTLYETRPREGQVMTIRCFAYLGNFIGRNKDIFNKLAPLYYLCSVCGHNRVCVSSWISNSASLTTTPFFAPAIVIHIS